MYMYGCISNQGGPSAGDVYKTTTDLECTIRRHIGFHVCCRMEPNQWWREANGTIMNHGHGGGGGGGCLTDLVVPDATWPVCLAGVGETVILLHPAPLP